MEKMFLRWAGWEKSEKIDYLLSGFVEDEVDRLLKEKSVPAIVKLMKEPARGIERWPLLKAVFDLFLERLTEIVIHEEYEPQETVEKARKVLINLREPIVLPYLYTLMKKESLWLIRLKNDESLTYENYWEMSFNRRIEILFQGIRKIKKCPKLFFFLLNLSTVNVSDSMPKDLSNRIRLAAGIILMEKLPHRLRTGKPKEILQYCKKYMGPRFWGEMYFSSTTQQWAEESFEILKRWYKENTKNKVNSLIILH